MSFKGKVATCVKKIFEATQACEHLNQLQEECNENNLHVQAFFILDTGKKTHISGYGNIFDNFLANQQLGYFSGKGTVLVEASDPRHKKCSLQIERCQTECKKKKIEVKENSKGE